MLRRPERAALEALVEEAAELPCVVPEQAALEQAIERFDRWQARSGLSRGLLSSLLAWGCPLIVVHRCNTVTVCLALPGRRGSDAGVA